VSGRLQGLPVADMSPTLRPAGSDHQQAALISCPDQARRVRGGPLHLPRRAFGAPRTPPLLVHMSRLVDPCRVGAGCSCCAREGKKRRWARFARPLGRAQACRSLDGACEKDKIRPASGICCNFPPAATRQSVPLRQRGVKPRKGARKGALLDPRSARGQRLAR
jgi:hypothetical protein